MLPAVHHLRQDRAAAAKRAGEVDVHDVVPVAIGRHGQQRLAPHTGVVDQGVNLAERCFDLAHERHGPFPILQFEQHPVGSTVRCGFDRARLGVVPPVGERDCPAISQQCLDNGAADAAVAAGDQCDLHSPLWNRARSTPAAIRRLSVTGR
jgi:hypothetical protein